METRQREPLPLDALRYKRQHQSEGEALYPPAIKLSLGMRRTGRSGCVTRSALPACLGIDGLRVEARWYRVLAARTAS